MAPPWHGFTSRIFSVADTLSNSHANRVFVIISIDDQSHLQPKCFNYIESWKIPLHMHNTCGNCACIYNVYIYIYILACATYVPSIS